MKKIAITTLFLLNTTLFASMFSQNTDIKTDYEFDLDISAKNAQLAQRLSMFQNGEASEHDIKLYLKAKEDNNTQAYAQDVKLDEEIMRPIDKEAAVKNRSWLASIYISIFSDEEPTIVQENNQTNQEQGAE